MGTYMKFHDGYTVNNMFTQRYAINKIVYANII